MEGYHNMYTTNLKKQIKQKLFSKNGVTLNCHIHRKGWFTKNNNESLLDEINKATIKD